MSVVYNTTLKNTRMDAVTTAIGAAGYIEIGTAAMAAVLATINLANPAAAAASGGVLTLSGTPLTCASAAATGTAAAARVRNGSAVDIITGLTVGTSGSDINLNSTSIVSGQPVTITSATITHG